MSETIRKDLIIKHMETNLESMIEKDAGLEIITPYYERLITHYKILRTENIKLGDPMKTIIQYHDYYNKKYNEENY